MTEEVLDEAEVVARGLRQVLEAAGARDVLVPTRQLGVGARDLVQDRLVVGELAEACALGPRVLRGHGKRIDAGEDVELRDREAGEAVESHRVAERHEVEPAAAPGAASGGTELAARLAQAVAHLVVELRGEGAGAYPRDVGLGDAPGLVDVLRPHPRADAGRAGDGVGRGDERIGAVVDVEQRALGAFEQHEPAAVERVPDDPLGVRDERLEPMAERAVLLGHRV